MKKLEEREDDDILYPAGVVRESTPVDDVYDMLFPAGIGPGNESTSNEDDILLPVLLE